MSTRTSSGLKNGSGRLASGSVIALDDRLSPPAREADRAVTKPRRIETYERDDQTGPTGVGSVSVSRGKFEALLTMPGDALTPFFANADCRKIEIHRSAWRAHAISPTIKSYRLEMNMDEDDMPADA